MDKKKASDLLNKYIAGNCSPEEKRWVEHAYNLSIPEGSAVDEESYLRKKALMWKQINEGKKIRATPLRRWIPYAAAALILLALSFGTYYFIANHTGNTSGTGVRQLADAPTDIDPGGNRAILTLADGRKIILEEAADGQLAEEGGIRITKTEDGQIVYDVAGWRASVTRAPTTYNTIQTPKGGQYQVTLPDGTKVWLNAASTLKYPSAFSGESREVTFEGEAYFEVAHNKQKPFRVLSENQVIEVLGTSFNSSNYRDEATSRTVLVEGKVKVGTKDMEHSQILTPGNQAVLASGKIRIEEADVEAATAWRSGQFLFNDETLEEIMRKIARWYDVEVVYEGADKQERFGGGVSRYDQVSTVLQRLEAAGNVHFKIERRKIIVTP